MNLANRYPTSKLRLPAATRRVISQSTAHELIDLIDYNTVHWGPTEKRLLVDDYRVTLTPGIDARIRGRTDTYLW